jgi:hypothetical protein
MLGRKGHDAILIDPHKHYPPDFRCEKLDASQIELLRRTGLADAVFRAATVDQQVWIGRFGHVVERKPNGQPGILYNDLSIPSARKFRLASKSSPPRRTQYQPAARASSLHCPERNLRAIDRVGERAQSRSASPTRDPW